MKIKSELIDYLRTLIRGEFAVNDQIEEKLDEIGWDGWPALLTMAYYLAVQHHFAGRYQEAEAIRLVAELRSRISTNGPEIDPASAESLLKAVFDNTVPVDIHPEELGRIELLTIYGVLSGGRISDAELDRLLDKARELAEENI